MQDKHIESLLQFSNQLATLSQTLGATLLAIANEPKTVVLPSDGPNGPAAALAHMKEQVERGEGQFHPALRTPEARRRLEEATVNVVKEIVAEYNLKNPAPPVQGAQEPANRPPRVNKSATADQLPPRENDATPQEKAAREAAIWETDLANLTRTIRTAFSVDVSPDCHGKLRWRDDNDDHFAVDLFNVDKKTAVGWPSGFYRDEKLKTKQYKGELTDIQFILNFGHPDRELCYLILTNIEDNIYAPLSTFTPENRRTIISGIWEYLLKLVKEQYPVDTSFVDGTAERANLPPHQGTPA